MFGETRIYIFTVNSGYNHGHKFGKVHCYVQCILVSRDALMYNGERTVFESRLLYIKYCYIEDCCIVSKSIVISRVLCPELTVVGVFGMDIYVDALLLHLHMKLVGF